MGFPIALAIASGFAKMQAGQQESNAEIAALQRQNAIKMQMQKQLRERNSMNNLLLERKRDEFIGRQTTEVAASGFSLEGTTLIEMSKTAEDVSRQQIINNMELDAEIGRLDAEIAMNRAMEKDIDKAANTRMIGDMLSIGANAYSSSFSGRGTSGASMISSTRKAGV